MAMIAGILYSSMRHLMEEYDDGTWYISTKVLDWVDENEIRIQEKEFILENGSIQFGLYFENEEDYLAFRLRWL